VRAHLRAGPHTEKLGSNRCCRTTVAFCRKMTAFRNPELPVRVDSAIERPAIGYGSVQAEFALERRLQQVVKAARQFACFVVG